MGWQSPKVAPVLWRINQHDYRQFRADGKLCDLKAAGLHAEATAPMLQSVILAVCIFRASLLTSTNLCCPFNNKSSMLRIGQFWARQLLDWATRLIVWLFVLFAWQLNATQQSVQQYEFRIHSMAAAVLAVDEQYARPGPVHTQSRQSATHPST